MKPTRKPDANGKMIDDYWPTAKKVSFIDPRTPVGCSDKSANKQVLPKQRVPIKKDLQKDSRSPKILRQTFLEKVFAVQHFPQWINSCNLEILSRRL